MEPGTIDQRGRKTRMIAQRNIGWMVLLLFACLTNSRAQDGVIDRRVDSLLRRMTLEEKCGQLNQIAAHFSKDGKTYLEDSEKALIRQGLVGSILSLSGAGAVGEIQRIAVGESRLRIPLMIGMDVIHGYRTIFPVPLGEASTWDPQLVERSASIAANEASSAGIHWTFAPMVDIARDPRWGRIVEGSGEDPFLGSAMAAARVKGFQGTRLSDSNSILACAKHFAAYGGAEAGRDYNVVDVSERTLREVYLKPFKSAVDAGAGSIMSSFNEIAGVPCSANRWLMTDVLRKEWGFKGFVVSDWTAIDELMRHGIAAGRAEAGALAINAGVDMDMVSGIYLKELPGLVRAGAIQEAVIDEAVRRILRMKFALGLFDNPYRGVNPERERQSILTGENLSAALEAARKSIVLLKNEKHLLPLAKQVKTIAVIGPLSDNREDPLGPWHAAGKPQDVVTVLQGIKARGSSSVNVLYSKGCEIEDSAKDFSDAVDRARHADIAVVVLGESEQMSGEASSRSSLDLPGVQNRLLQEITGTGTPIVLVLMNGRPLTINWAAEHVPAILESWFPGVQSGNAIAAILFGDENPSGKLPLTFPRSVGQIPLYYNHKNTGRPFDEQEKYTSKYLDLPNSPLYPFGYGLSYTTFAYSDLNLSSTTIGVDDSLPLSVRVKNSGPRKGVEVVQLYLRDDVASVTRPVKELKRFTRVSLEPGESKTVNFTITPEDLQFYDPGMKRVVEPGTFTVFVGTNSVDVIESKFKVQ